MRAEFHYGEVYEKLLGNREEAEEKYRLLSKKGHTYGQFKLGKLLFSNVEDDVFKDEKDVTKESDLTDVAYEELRPTRRRKPFSEGGRAKKPKYYTIRKEY